MKTAGIIAEYNPFHNGHLYHINETKKSGFDHIVVAMSSNVVQRSEVASFSKWTRAYVAIQNGADLVVEIPAVYSVATAEKFAFAGVSLLNGLGVVDTLSFGSESGNIKELSDALKAITSDEVSQEIVLLLKDGISYPKAREKAVLKIYSNKISKLLRTPNNILAIEYLKALKETSSLITPLTIKRKGVNHDSNFTDNNFASASFIRENLSGNFKSLEKFFPESAFELLNKELESKSGGASMTKLNEAILYKLRTMSVDDFKNLPDVSEGLEYRLFTEAKKAVSTDDFLKRVKTKRYTLSRIKRIVIYAMLDIKKDISYIPPQYIRVLAFNKKGKELLKEAKLKATLPIYHSFAKLQKDFPVFAEKEALATDLFRYSCPEIQKGNSEYCNKAPFSLI